MNIIFSSVIGDEFTLGATAIIFFTSLITGFILSQVYTYTNIYDGRKSIICQSIVSLPFSIGAVLMLSKTNSFAAVLFAVILGAGILKMENLTQKDIIYIISSSASGVMCGMGYVACAAYYTVIFSVCVIVAEKIKIFREKSSFSILTVGISQMDDYDNAFDDIFKKYLSYCKMLNVKADSQYDQYNLEYLIEVKKGVCEKSFIDAIRARNGNLFVAITKDSQHQKAA